MAEILITRSALLLTLFLFQGFDYVADSIVCVCLCVCVRVSERERYRDTLALKMITNKVSLALSNVILPSKYNL